MGKSKAKAKTNKRLRRSRREYIDQEVTSKKKEQLFSKLLLSTKGFEYRDPHKPNAFLYPSSMDAEFPQFVPNKPLDFRSSHNPFSGNELAYGKRKDKTGNQVNVKLAGDVDEDIKQTNKKIDTQEIVDEEDLINTMVNMKILDTKYKPKNIGPKRLGKKNSKRNLKKTKRATRF